MTEGLARDGFDKDLLLGKAREDAFIRAAFQGATVEHKSDQKTRETGNLFIEFETSSEPNGAGDIRPSGIAITKESFWAHEFDDDCWLFVPVHRIEALMREAIHRGMSVWGGDYNRSHGALVPATWLVRPPKPKPQAAMFDTR